MFSAYGNVKSTKIIVDRAGVSKGYGFVTFETEQEAQRLQSDVSFNVHGLVLNHGRRFIKSPMHYYLILDTLNMECKHTPTPTPHPSKARLFPVLMDLCSIVIPILAIPNPCLYCIMCRYVGGA